MKPHPLKNKLAFVFGLAIAVVLLLAMLPNKAHAGKPKMPPPPKHPPISMEADLSAKQIQKLNSTNLAKSRSSAAAKAGAEAGASAMTGPVTLDANLVGGETSATGGSTGDWVNVSEHTFYSYAQSDRPAVGCFKSGDAAGGNDGKFGALGFYWLDGNCWADHLAAQELDVELNARLKCSARKYRNAIAFDVKRDKQAACVQMVKNSGLALIEQERAAMQAEIDRQKGLVEHGEQVCNEANERQHQACMEK